jgi:trigger factor
VKIKIEDIKGSQKLIRIEVGPQRVEAALDKAYNGISKNARIPGFRPGKAPLDLLKAHYDKEANEDAINSLIWDCYRDAVIERDIKATGYPVISDVDFSKDKPLSFSVKVDVNPDFRLKQYKGIRTNEKSYDVTDDDIEKTVKQLQESMAEYKNIDPRPIKTGDYVVCFYECFENGKLVDKKDKLWLYISDKLQPKELLEVLLGAEINVLKEALASYPEDYEYKELAGKQRLYKVTPKQIKEKTLPAVDDDMAKAAGNFADLKALKEALKENILHSKKLESKRDLENQIYEYLLKAHVFDVPVSLVERQLSRLVEDAKQKLLYQGYKKEDLDKQDDTFKGTLQEQAVKNVRLFFIIDKIAKQESIQASPEDIEKQIKDISAHTKEDADKVKKRLEENKLTDSLKEQIIHDKVVEFLIKQAVVRNA